MTITRYTVSPPLTALTAGTTYRVEVKYTSSGNVLEDYFIVVAEL